MRAVLGVARAVPRTLGRTPHHPLPPTTTTTMNPMADLRVRYPRVYDRTKKDEPLIGANGGEPGGYPYVAADMPRALCGELPCNEPTLECNHTQLLRAQWGVGYVAVVVLQELLLNTMLAFTLAFLTVAFAPSSGFNALLIYAFGYAAGQFFIQVTWSGFTGAYGNPVLSLLIWIVFSYVNRGRPAAPGVPGRAGVAMGSEFIKVIIFWVVQLAGNFAGVALAILAFGFPLFATYSYGKPQITTLLGDPALPALTIYQSIFYETIASIVMFTVVVIAHTTEHIKVSNMQTGLLVSSGYFTAKLLFGWQTGAIGNIFYWLVTSIYSGNYAGWESYVFGPLIAMLLVLVGFILYNAARAYVCAVPVCVTPAMLDMRGKQAYEQGRADALAERGGAPPPPAPAPGAPGPTGSGYY